MNTVAKILIVVNLVLAGGFLASAGTFLGKQDLWKRKHEAVTKAKDQLEVEKDAQIAQLAAEKARLNESSRDMQAKLATAEETARQSVAQADLMKEAFDESSTQLTNLATAFEKAQDTLSNNQTQIANLQRELGEQREAKRVALDAKEAAVRSLAEKEIQFEALSDRNQAQAARIEDLQNQVRSAELTAQAAVSKVGGALDIPMDQPNHRGKIVSVTTQGDIAVISLGEEDGVKPGFKYTVSRGSQYVGMIEITDVQARKSAGRAIRELSKSRIQLGDRVMSR